jgi:hypothetical protein
MICVENNADFTARVYFESRFPSEPLRMVGHWTLRGAGLDSQCTRFAEGAIVRVTIEYSNGSSWHRLCVPIFEPVSSARIRIRGNLISGKRCETY